jgi:hypothetical protein
VYAEPVNLFKRIFDFFSRLRSALKRLPQLEAENIEARRAFAAAVESYAIVRQERDQMLFEADPVNRRMLTERGKISDEVEAWMLAGSGPSMVAPTRESIKNALPAEIKISERLWELELALEDRGWQRQLALSQVEFSRYGIQQIMLISRLYFIKNPVIRRAVLISSDYVFGRGLEITCDDEAANEVIQAFLVANEKELGHLGLTEKDQTLHTDGNLFFVLFTDEGTGEQSIRTIDATEIDDILTDPDDSSRPLYYKRRWLPRVFDPVAGVNRFQPQEQRWYPAIDNEKPEAIIGGIEVLVDQPVLHMKTGGIAKWIFGCPEVYSAIDWARAYRQYLEDWATVNRALARFTWDVKTQGGVQAVQNLQKVFSTTLGVGTTQPETNPVPPAGSSFVSTKDKQGQSGTSIDPIKTNIQSSPEQGRRIGLMVCSALGLPETMLFGDTSTGSLATATSLDRPTELKFLQRQELWRAFLQRIITHLLKRSSQAPSGKLREAATDLKKLTITIKFPAVLEHDIKQMVEAIVAAVTLNGFSPAKTIDIKTASVMLMSELGVEDPHAVVEEMYPEDTYDPEVVEDEPEPVTTQPAPGVPAQQKRESARLSYAVRKLIEASERLETK